MENRYQNLVDAYNHASTEEKFLELKAAFEELGDFEKSQDYVAKCDHMLEYSKGKMVIMGNYNGQPLEWKVIAQKGRERFLLLNSVIPGVTFHFERENVFWRESELRKWLNSQFLNEAFTLKEKMNIIFTNVKTPRNPVWETEGGPDARDKVFCLSCQEVEEYLPEMSDRAMGEWWWLRTLGHCLLAAEAVYIDGTVYDIGLNVVDTGVGVRPAMWIRLGR